MFVILAPRLNQYEEYLVYQIMFFQVSDEMELPGGRKTTAHDTLPLCKQDGFEIQSNFVSEETVSHQLMSPVQK